MKSNRSVGFQNTIFVWRETKTVMLHNVSFIVCLEDDQHKTITWYNNPQILERKEIPDWVSGIFVHFACQK